MYVLIVTNNFSSTDRQRRRDILRQLQRAGGWNAEQSRAILDTSR